MKYRILCVFIWICVFAHAQETNAPKFGKGILNFVGQDSTWSMKMGLRMQFLALANWESQDHKLINPESSFLIRRSRLKFDGFAFSPDLQYKIEFGLANSDMSGTSEFTSNTPRYIYDAVLQWNFYKNFVLWVGQTKLPGNRERVISSANLQLVDRSLLNAEFNIDRDVGMQLRHHFNLFNNFIVKEIFAFSQGEGRNVTTGNIGGYQYTGRVELLPWGDFEDEGDYFGGDLKREVNPKLSIGITYDYNNDAVKTASNMGDYMFTDSGFHETDISTLFIDTMFKYKGFSFMGEYAHRDAEDPVAENSDGTLTGDVVQVGNGLNLQAGYLFKNNLEVSGRYTNIELDSDITGKNPEDQYTLGISKYIVGHKLKVQSDISYLSVDNSNDELMYRLQFEIHF